MTGLVNNTSLSGLALLSAASSSRAQSARTSANTGPVSTADPSKGPPRVFNSIDQIFSILHAAEKQTSRGSAASATVEAAYSSQLADVTSSVDVSLTVLAPSATQQIASAVAQVNALISEINPADLPNPAARPAQSANANNAVVVTVGDGSGALAQPQGLGLPNGLSTPTTIAQALGQLSQSSVAGVAAAASSLLDRLLPNADGKTAAFVATPTELAAGNLEDNASPLSLALSLIGVNRDSSVLSLAESLIGTAPPYDAAAQADAAQYLANTYNGSFTLVKAPYAPATSANYQTNGVEGYIGGDNNGVWYIVFPRPTVTVTARATVTVSGGK